MGRIIVTHIDDAPVEDGEPPRAGKPLSACRQFIGDMKQGPWIHILSVEANRGVKPHTHDQSEVMFILEGQLRLGDRVCGPGTVVYVEKDTQYGFTVGPAGVRMLNIREGLARITRDGVTWLPRDPARGDIA